MNIHPTSGRFLPLAFTLLLAPCAFSQAPLTIGNLLVVRFGDNLAANTSVATAVFLDEYTTGGTLVQSIPMPTVAAGLNRAFTNSGSSTSEGQLNVASNGLYFTLGGYDAALGTVGVATSMVATNNRVIGRIDLAAAIDTSTALTDAYDQANLRGVATDDGTRFWTTGSAGPAGAIGPSHGVRYIANLGDTTSTVVNSGAPNNCRQVSVYHGDLYLTSASGTTFGVARVGTGLPTSPQSIALLPGFPTLSGPSSYDFFFANPTTVYVADDATNGGGGIKKWVLSGGTWTNPYNLTLNGTTGNIGITGFVQGGVTTLWATTKIGNGATAIMSVVDAGPGSVASTIVAAPANARFRGIRHIGLPGNSQRFPIGCGGANIKVTGNGQLGTDMHTSITNSFFGIGLIGYGLFPVLFPFCPSCTIGHEWTVFVGQNDHTLNVLPSWATLGLTIYVQAADLLAPGGCADPLLTLTDMVSFTVQ